MLDSIIHRLLTLHRYFYALNDVHHYKHKNKIMWLYSNIGAKLCARMIPILVKKRSTQGLLPLNKRNRTNNIVVSLTSFPKRISTIWMTIDSLMRQSVTPQHIILVLSEENFPQKEKDLPQNLLQYVALGLEIAWVKDDLRPHKKYMYAFQNYPNACVVTVDDDMYYRPDMLERLIRLHKLYPQCVCANNGKKLLPNEEYRKWNKAELIRNTPSQDAIAIGFGGILYPVSQLSNTPIFDRELIQELSLGTDDLWLKTMELLSNTDVVIGDYYCPPPIIEGSQEVSLSQENWSKKTQNDINWEKLVKHFNLYSKL